MKTLAEVWITPEGSNQELGKPIVFSRNYNKTFVRNYARACRAKGQKARIVWLQGSK